MPHPELERLEKESTKSQVNAAVSACVAREVANGKPQDQAVAMCLEMSRKQTGAPPSQGGT